MSDFAVAHLDEIDEISDGRCPWRPVRHHLGITSFGINSWTGRESGDRIRRPGWSGFRRPWKPPPLQSTDRWGSRDGGGSG